MSITVESFQPIIQKHKEWLDTHSEYDEVREILVLSSDEIIKTIVRFLNDSFELRFFFGSNDLPPRVRVWLECAIHGELARNSGPMYSSIDFDQESRKIVGKLDLMLETLNRTNLQYDLNDLAEIMYVNLQMGMCYLLNDNYVIASDDEMSVDGLE